MESITRHYQINFPESKTSEITNRRKMKIGFCGFEMPEGKIKYNDLILKKLEEKFLPKKVSPYFAEFIEENFVQCDGVLIATDSLLDLLILDLEKFETRDQRSESEEEKKLVQKCLKSLENEIPLCNVDFSDSEIDILNALAPLSFKPTVVLDEQPDVNEAIKLMLKATKTMFFYTAGKQEVHAWPMPEGSNAVTCAGKIHSDLARGFIKADVVTYSDLLTAHNLNDARSKGLVQLVDKKYIIKHGDVIEIRFNV